MSEVIVKLTSDHIKVKGGEYVRDYSHGEWIYHKNDMSCVRWSKWECSMCHERVEHKSNFCPNCGARMKGAEE